MGINCVKKYYGYFTKTPVAAVNAQVHTLIFLAHQLREGFNTIESDKSALVIQLDVIC